MLVRTAKQLKIKKLGDFVALTEDQVIKALEPVQDPELRRSIVELGMVQQVSIEGTKVDILIFSFFYII